VPSRSTAESPTTNKPSHGLDDSEQVQRRPGLGWTARAFAGLIDIFFPPSCAACGAVTSGSEPFCLGCELELERLPEQHCLRCSEPGNFERGHCPRCELRPPPFAHAFAPFLHQGPIARAIHQFKYEDHPELAPILAALLAREARAFIDAAPGILCAIPLHRNRLRRRQYDQAQLLVQQLAHQTRRKPGDCLRRIRNTRRQVGLTETQREQNVAGCFEACGDLSEKSVLLLDDVFTTGATARTAASVLRAAGATEVRVLAIARAFSQT
jgi:ComF family protein